MRDLQNLKALAAFSYHGFDGSVFYSKLDPKGIKGNLYYYDDPNYIEAVDNFSDDAATTPFGHKAATLVSYELGYTTEKLLEIGTTSFSVDYGHSKNLLNDGSSYKLTGARFYQQLSKSVELNAAFQTLSFGGFKVLSQDSDDDGYYDIPKTVKSFTVSLQYLFQSW